MLTSLTAAWTRVIGWLGQVSMYRLVMLALSACTAREVPYEDEIASWHADKDRFMRESPDSPVLAPERAAFPPLPYYPINREYRVRPR